jgi:polyisoprenoid-binding protein YceI
MTRHVAALTVLVVGVAVAAIIGGAAGHSYTIDAGRSKATIEVGKAGAFSFAAGHTHEVVAPKITGTIVVDVDDPVHSSVRATIDASALKVTGKGESAGDVPKVQETMAGAQVLDVQQYPTIAFASKSVALKTRAGASLDVAVTGTLTIKGVAREITVPVNVRMEGGTLTATGQFPVKQSEFGIKPVSVGGVVSVKDAVNISFTIVGQ